LQACHGFERFFQRGLFVEPVQIQQVDRVEVQLAAACVKHRQYVVPARATDISDLRRQIDRVAFLGHHGTQQFF